MELTGSSLVGGESTADGGAAFHGINPATGAALEPAFREASAETVDRALHAADAASRGYGRMPCRARAAFLRAIADEIMATDDALLERAHAETALPVPRLQSERGRTVNQLRMFADLLDEGSWVEARIDTAEPARMPLPRPDLRRMLVPVGPVGIFAASNFPFAFSVAGGDTASALAAGCPVVCKAHPAHPGTSELTARAIDRAARATGTPPGVFSLLHGWSHEVGLAIVRHPLTRAIGFTGSLRGGRAIYDAAASRPDPIPVYAELGSINPVFLLPSALAQRAEAIADGLAQSITLGVGQFCTNPGVVLALRGASLDHFTALLALRLGAATPGVMLYERLRASYAAALERARAGGATPLTSADGGATRAAAALLAIDTAQFVADAALREEMFGPVSMIVTASDAAELERVAESLEGQLTATIHGTEAELAEHAGLVEILRRKAGRLVFNGYPTGVEVTHAMHHGGPYPASTDARTTSVGSAAIARFARPVCLQNFPEVALPAALDSSNSLGIWRLVNGVPSRAALA